MAESITLPAPAAIYEISISNDGETNEHLVIGFSVTGSNVSPIHYPPIAKGAKLIRERPGFYELDGIVGRTVGELAQQLRERLS